MPVSVIGNKTKLDNQQENMHDMQKTELHGLLSLQLSSRNGSYRQNRDSKLHSPTLSCREPPSHISGCKKPSAFVTSIYPREPLQMGVSHRMSSLKRTLEILWFLFLLQRKNWGPRRLNNMLQVIMLQVNKWGTKIPSFVI